MMSRSHTAATPILVEEGKDVVTLGANTVDSNSSSNNDSERQSDIERPKLKRKLKARHLQMIAIGTSIFFTMT